MGSRWDQFARALAPADELSAPNTAPFFQGVGHAAKETFDTIQRWENDASLPSSRGDEDIGKDAVMLGPAMLLPGFGRAAGGIAARLPTKSFDPLPPQFRGRAPESPIQPGFRDDTAAWFIEGDKPVYGNASRAGMDNLVGPEYAKKFDDYHRIDIKDADGNAHAYWIKPNLDPKQAQVVNDLVRFKKTFSPSSASDAEWATQHQLNGKAFGYPDETVAGYVAREGGGSELGVFGGRIGARNMAASGREGPTKALDMAEKMEAAGMDYATTRRAVNQWIEKNDPALGGVTQGADGKWRFEISDKNAKLTPELQSAFEGGGLHTRDFTVGEGLDHPELFQMHPDIASMEMRVHKSATPMQRGYHQDSIGRSPELEAIVGKDNGRISATADTPEGVRSIALHEAGGHAVQAREGFARGAAAKGSGYVGKEDAIDIISSWPVGGSLTKHIADLQAKGELPLEYGTPRAIADRVNYWRSAGEIEAGDLVQGRAHMSPAELRKVDPKLMQSVPDELQIVRGAEGPENVVTTQDVHRIASELGLDATAKPSGGGTTYIKLRDPDQAVKPLEVRVPSADGPHGGPMRPWRLDTSMEGTRNPHPNHFNVAGEDLGDPAVLRDRLAYGFGKLPPESAPAAALPEGGPINDPRQLKLLSGGLPVPPNIWDQFEEAR